MEQKEKLLMRGLCGIFALIALLSLAMGIWKTQKADRTLTLLRISSEELLYESAAEAEAALQTMGENREDPNWSARLLRAAVGGQMCLVSLEGGEEQITGLMRFFSDLEQTAAGKETGGVREYAARLLSHLSETREKGASLWENMPVYAEAVQQPSSSSGHVMQALSEKEARALAMKALGGNLKLERATIEDQNGYAYLLRNAYVRIGVSGRVVGMLREMSYPQGTAEAIGQKEAEEAAVAALMSAGYDRRSISVQGGDCEELIWQIAVQYGEIPLTVGISAVSGAWCELRENETATE